MSTPVPTVSSSLTFGLNDKQIIGPVMVDEKGVAESKAESVVESKKHVTCPYDEKGVAESKAQSVVESKEHIPLAVTKVDSKAKEEARQEAKQEANSKAQFVYHAWIKYWSNIIKYQQKVMELEELLTSDALELACKRQIHNAQLRPELLKSSVLHKRAMTLAVAGMMSNADASFTQLLERMDEQLVHNFIRNTILLLLSHESQDGSQHKVVGQNVIDYVLKIGSPSQSKTDEFVSTVSIGQIYSDSFNKMVDFYRNSCIDFKCYKEDTHAWTQYALLLLHSPVSILPKLTSMHHASRMLRHLCLFVEELKNGNDMKRYGIGDRNEIVRIAEALCRPYTEYCQDAMEVMASTTSSQIKSNA